MTEAPLVSVLMPTYQGMEFLERVLDALAGQVTPFAWEMIAIDSNSSDGTWELLGARAGDFPVRLERERIHGVEFDHGDTRNLLAARSRGRILVFLTQDAIPASEDWLATLVANFDDPDVGAVTCRNVPRPDAEVLTKIFSATDPGYVEGRREVRLPDAEAYAAMGPHEKRLLYNFNDVAAAYRRDLWERHPFPRTNFGEDILMARAFLEAGFTVVYDDEATVEHSHDYDAEETEKRAAIDAAFNAEWLDRICVGSAKDAEVLTDRLSAEDSCARGAGIRGGGAREARGPGARAAPRGVHRPSRGRTHLGSTPRDPDARRWAAAPPLRRARVPARHLGGDGDLHLQHRQGDAAAGSRGEDPRPGTGSRGRARVHVHRRGVPGPHGPPDDTPPGPRQPRGELPQAGTGDGLPGSARGVPPRRGALPAPDPHVRRTRRDRPPARDRDGRDVPRLLGALQPGADDPAGREHLPDEHGVRLLPVREGEGARAGGARGCARPGRRRGLRGGGGPRQERQPPRGGVQWRSARGSARCPRRTRRRICGSVRADSCATSTSSTPISWRAASTRTPSCSRTTG